MAIPFLSDISGKNATFAGSITASGTGLSTIASQLYVGQTSDYFGSNTNIQLNSGASNKNVGIRSNILYLYSHGNGSEAKLIFGDGSANFGLFSNDTEFALYNYGTSSNSITVNRSTHAADFAGTILINGVSNYTGLEVKGSGASRPSIQFSNVNQGDLGQIYGTENNALVIGTGTSSNAAVTLNSDQTVNFHNSVYFSSSNVGLISWGSMGGGTGFGIRGESGRALSLGSNGAWDKLIINTSGDAIFAGAITATGTVKATNTSTGNSLLMASATGTGYAGMYLDASNGDFSGGDYFSIRQLNDLSIEFESRASAGNTIFKSKGSTNLTMDGANSNFAGTLTIPSYIYHASDTDTYFGFSAANTYKVHTGGSDRFQITGDVHVVGSTDFAIPAARKLYLDGQGNTYLTESSADTIKIFTGGTEALEINSSQNATFKGNVSIQADDADFLVRSNDYTISRIISRGSSGTNLDKGLFSLMSSDGTNNNIEKVRIDSAGGSWFNGGDTAFGGDISVDDAIILGAAGATGIVKTKDNTGTNAAGGSLQLYGGRSTGTGAGGDIQFFVSPAGSSGTSANTWVSALHIEGSDKSATFAGDVTLTDGILTVNDGNNYVKISEGSNSIGQVELKDSNPVFVQGWGSDFRVAVGTYNNHALTINSSKNATFAGSVTATSFSGDGSNLTNVSATATDNTKLPLAGGTLTGDLIISTSGTGGSPCLRINNLNHTTFNHGIEVYNGNLVAGESEIILVGKSGSTKNSGYIGYNWAADASNNNYVTIGQYGANHIFRVYGDHVLSTVSLRSNADVRGTVFYDSDNTSYFFDGTNSDRSMVTSGSISIGTTGQLGLGDITHPKIVYPGKEASWDGSGSTTGQVVIDLPGTLANYDMMYMEIHVYEYGSEAASKIIIGGHNWNSGGNSNTGTTQWYNNGVQVIGAFSKPIYLGRRNDGSNERRCIALGDTTSTWSYGTVHVAKVHGACYYTDSIDWMGNWNVAQTTSSSYFTANPATNWNTGATTTLKTPGRAQASYMTATVDMRSPIYYDNNNTSFYLNPASNSVLNNLQIEDYISHKGDPSSDTYFGFPGNDNFAVVTAGGTGFTIDSNRVAYLKGKVGINTTDPDSQGYSYAEDLVILGGNSASDGVGITLRGNGKRYGVIAFGDNADDNPGEIYYDHNSDQMYFRTGTSVGLEISSGNVVYVSDIRSTIYYDSNNTDFYANPASRSQFGSLDLNSGTVWDETTQGVARGSLHLDPNNSTDHAGGAITFGASDSSSGTTSQAGIYVRSDGSYGTKMYLSTTDSYASGSKTGLKIDHSGNVTVVRGGLYSTIFYDSNDTTYYLDPSNTGTSLKAAGKVEHKGLSMTDGTNVDQIKEFTMTFQLAANTWTDTGINGTDLTTGTYAVQVYVDDYGVGGNHYTEYYSGMMSWFSTNTNNTSVDELVLHRAGHSPNAGDIQLRTERVLSADSNDLMLQVKHNQAYNAALDNSSGKSMRFKFRRLI